MKLFNLDLHISVIADIKNILTEQGHTIDNWCLSGHSWVFGKEKDSVDVVNQNTWRQLDENLANKFYERYEEDLKEYDGFVVTHTPCFSMLYEKFNKPIIVVASTRYEDPFSSDMLKWMKFNKYLQNGIDSGQIIPLSNNKYDSAYTEYFTNRKWPVIPSLCEYTNSKYTGNKEKFLYFSKLPLNLNNKNLISKEEAFKSGYSWQDLYDYRGIVHIPYNASTMSIFEQYTANVPLFFPSWEFLGKLREEVKGTGVLSETSWNQVHGLNSNSYIISGLDDPNNFINNQNIMEWTKLSDFYDKENMPHIQHFDSFEHLNFLLEHVDLKEVSKKMEEHNKQRRREVYDKWRRVLQQC